jgi:SAM-dependent methyltransferase
MHPSSLNNMRIARDKYLSSHLSPTSLILDVGGRGLTTDRSYRSIFEGQFRDYFVADISDGVGVTHVMPGPYTLPFEDNTFDLIVSGQMLEHCNNPFKSVTEMKRVLKPSAYIILIAPSSGPRHDDQDCWRFMDDAWKAIATDVDLELIACWITRDAPDERSRKWQDNVFVGRKP